jgi:hypothetical protein
LAPLAKCRQIGDLLAQILDDAVEYGLLSANARAESGAG